MRKLMKGFASLLVIATMILGVTVLTYAEPTQISTPTQVVKNYCGKSATWTYDKETSTLTISGKGTIKKNKKWKKLKPEKVVIESGITRINRFTFEGLKSVKEVSITKTVNWIGDYAFSETGIEEINIDSELKYAGYRVFADCKSLTSVTWNDDTVPEYAFAGCRKLKKINLRENVKFIEAAAFYDTGIENYKVPDNIIGIERNAFSGCDKLERLTLSKRVSTVPAYIASDTPRLKVIIVQKGTKKISKYAFGETGAKKIVLPNSIREISSYAFSESDKLISIKIPNKVKSIKDCTFEYCTKLKQVKIGKSVTTIGENAFQNCKSLKSISIPKNVRTIGYEAFKDSGCKEVKIGNGVTTIEYWAFNNCSKLKTVYIGEKVKFVGENAFANCSKLSSITVSKNNPSYATKNGCLTNKKGTTLIAVPGAKSGEFQIPSGITKIESTAFYGCNKITKFASSHNGNFKAVDGILYNSRVTELYSCPISKKGTINIPDTVKAIKESAFQHSKASSIIIPNSVTSIGYSAFEYCKKLSTISIPGSVKSISNAAFWGCKNLRRVILGKGTQKIGRNAFHGCDKLRKITIPTSVSSIAKSAFSDCYGVTFYCKKSSAAMSYATRRYFIEYKLI